MAFIFYPIDLPNDCSPPGFGMSLSAVAISGARPQGYGEIQLFFMMWHNSPPFVELKDMRVVTGTLENWSLQNPLAKGGCGDTVTLRLNNGASVNFFKAKTSKEFYQPMKGQEWTVWVQSSVEDLLPNCRQFGRIKQIQHDSRIIGLYNCKGAYEASNRFAHKAMKFCIWFGLFSLLIVWRINRRKKTQLNENNEL
jgi:hypothetical protein